MQEYLRNEKNCEMGNIWMWEIFVKWEIFEGVDFKRLSLARKVKFNLGLFGKLDILYRCDVAFSSPFLAKNLFGKIINATLNLFATALPQVVSHNLWRLDDNEDDDDAVDADDTDNNEYNVDDDDDDNDTDDDEEEDKDDDEDKDADDDDGDDDDTDDDDEDKDASLPPGLPPYTSTALSSPLLPAAVSLKPDNKSPSHDDDDEDAGDGDDDDIDDDDDDDNNGDNDGGDDGGLP